MLIPERAILEANLAFYEAYSGQDYAAMDHLWARSLPVSCTHSGWQVLYGRRDVMIGWRAILESPAALPTRCSDPRCAIIDQAAIVTCVEHVAANRLAATNVFALEDGLWRMVHHQSAPFSPRVIPSDERPPPESLN